MQASKWVDVCSCQRQKCEAQRRISDGVNHWNSALLLDHQTPSAPTRF